MTWKPLAPDVSHRTLWSLTRELDDAGAEGRSHFNALCLRYWAPVQRHIRGRGHAEATARQLSQRFFARLLADGVARAARYSRFSDFLTSELDGFLAEACASHDVRPESPPGPDAHGGWPVAAVASLEHGIALQVVARSMARLRGEAADAGHLAMFECLLPYLSVAPHGDDLQREARALDATVLFVRLAVRRLRQRFRRIVVDELSQLVTEPRPLAKVRAAIFAAVAAPG